MKVKAFGSNDGKDKVLKEYQIVLEPNDRNSNIYLKALAIPDICTPVSRQDVGLALKQNDSLNNLQSADNGARNRKDIDLLIGADMYWQIVDGNLKNCETGLTAISSKLGWLLNGPVIDKGTSRSINVVNGHVMLVHNEINEEKTLANEVKKFWSLDMVGINENEASVYNKFNDKIKFKNGRYEVELPFKENHPILPDNYTICKSHLEKMRNKLNEDEELKRNYDDVFKEQLEARIIEKVDNERYEIGTITYLPHREVVHKDKSK